MQHFHILSFHQHVLSASRRNRPAPTLALENLGDRVSRELREAAQVSQDPALALVDARRLVAAARLVKVMTVVSAWKEVRDFAVQTVCTTRACQPRASAKAHVTANNWTPRALLTFGIRIEELLHWGREVEFDHLLEKTAQGVGMPAFPGGRWARRA